MKTIIIHVVASPEHPKFGNLGIQIKDAGCESGGWLPGSVRKLKLGESLINELKAHLERIKDEEIKDPVEITDYDLVKGAISDLEAVLYQKGR
jgi:hypothetical protein